MRKVDSNNGVGRDGWVRTGLGNEMYNNKLYSFFTDSLFASCEGVCMRYHTKAYILYH
jgi:hypothetical protein